MKKETKLQIRNSTAEFLIFTRQAGEDGIEVRVEGETVWLTQKLMAALFEITIPTINEHLTNLYSQGEIAKGPTIRNFRTVQKEGGRQVARNVDFYNLDAIIAVGFRVNSARAIQFRQWATGVLRDYAIRGYVLDKERLKNGAFFSKGPTGGNRSHVRRFSELLVSGSGGVNASMERANIRCRGRAGACR